MTERARKFIERSPRYVLRPQDRSDMRFSLEHSLGQGGIERTLLLNMSESGVAFAVEQDFAPKIGDRIKVEVPIPQGDRVAWWGKVVRTEVFAPKGWFNRGNFEVDTRVMVAVRFEQLPEPHTKAIRRGLNRSFMRAMRDQQYLTASYYRTAFLENFGKIILFGFLTAAVIAAIYLMTLPSANYDAKRGALWGDRFKFF